MDRVRGKARGVFRGRNREILQSRAELSVDLNHNKIWRQVVSYQQG